MIKLILICTIALIFTQVQGQDLRPIDIPIAVTVAFYHAYPSIRMVDWNKSGKNFEAGYRTDSLNRSVTFNSSGKLIETKMEILNEALPRSATKYLNENYKYEEINETSIITDENGMVTYATKIKDMILTFDSRGIFIRSEMN